MNFIVVNKLKQHWFLLDVREHVVGIFGHSGAGKSCLLKGIAGIAGEYVKACHYNGQSINNTPLNQSPIYYQDQNATLFPHLTVKKNLALVIGHGRFANECRYRLEQVIQWCQIESLLEQKPVAIVWGTNTKEQRLHKAYFPVKSSYYSMSRFLL